MNLLPSKTIHAIHEKAVEQGFQNQRDVMLSTVDPRYVAMLKQTPIPAAQLMLDLFAMNQVPRILGDVTPLREWLAQAAYFCAMQPETQRFFSERADEVARSAATGETGTMASASAATPAAPANLTLPERILFKSDLLPVAFLGGAVRTAAAVGRIVVPQIIGGMPVIKPSSGIASLAYGTGWLIGPCHFITNWHVIEARLAGSSSATQTDIDAQVAETQVEFGFDDQNNPPCDRIAVTKLVHGDRRLDYAVLRLAAVPQGHVQPLPLREKPLTFDPAAPFPVNIIQHPGSAAKQIALRNNLVVALQGDDLAYYTDTEVGSSGSPVCDDRWRVVALHKAATQRFGTVSYQGKDTAWVNVGTPITLIIEDLRVRNPEIWESLGATFA